MAIDAFLKIDGVRGESVDKAHPDEIDLLSYSFGVSGVSAAGGGGGLGSGRAEFSDVSFVARQSRATIDLLARAASGQHAASAVLSVRRSTATTAGVDYYTVTLTDCAVTSVNEAASTGGDDVPLTSFSLRYGRVQWSYRPVNDKGSVGPEVKTGWDVTANQKA